MINPFDGFLELDEVMVALGNNTIAEADLVSFLRKAKRALIAYGLPRYFSPTPIMQEAKITIEKNVSFIVLNEPILYLTSVNYVNQFSGNYNYLPHIDKNFFIFAKYQNYIETRVCFDYFNYLSIEQSGITTLNQSRVVQVTYVTGLDPLAKADILEFLANLYDDLGLDYQAPQLNAGIVKSVQADATKTEWTSTSGAKVNTLGNYLDNNPDLALLLSKYRVNKRLLY